MQNLKMIGHPIQLREVVVDKITAKRLGNENLNDKEFEISVNANTRVKINDSESAYAFLNINVSTIPKLFSMEVVLRGLCVNLKSPNRKELKEFIEINALSLLMPWAREIIASHTSKMGYPAFILPTINVSETETVNKNKKIALSDIEGVESQVN